MVFDAAGKRIFVATETGMSIVPLEEKIEWITLQGDHEVLSSESGDGLHRVTRRGNLALSSTDMTSVAYFGKWVFLGTSGGLVRIDLEAFRKKPDNAGSFMKIYDTESGLPADPVTSLYVMEESRRLIVGTEAGIAIMGPLDTGASTN